MSRWQGFYDELATERYPSLLAYAMAFTGQRATAEDLVQEALIRTFGRPRRLASAQHAESYVRRAIASVFIDDARRAAVVDRTAQRLGRASGADRPATDPTEHVDQRGSIAAALQQLTPQVRAAVVLRYYDDLTAAQIADRLGLALGTVKRYLHEGNARLRDLLAVDLPDEPEPDGTLETASVTITTHSGRGR